MKKFVLLLVAVFCLVFAASAVAGNNKPWYSHKLPNGNVVCNRNPHNVLNTFETKAACNASKDDESGDPGNNPPPVVVVDPVVSQDSAIWLCDTNNQLNDYSSGDALGLLAVGYVEAQAVDGNVDGGTNVGSFHLVCGSKLTPTGFYVGDGGSVYGADYGPARETTGFYSVVR